jgi:hypothetical protein
MDGIVLVLEQIGAHGKDKLVLRHDVPSIACLSFVTTTKLLWRSGPQVKSSPITAQAGMAVTAQEDRIWR